MAKRKNKTSALDDMINVASMLPWWAGIILAIISYVLLDDLSAPIDMTGLHSSRQFADLLTKVIFKAWATAGKFVLPIVFIAGAVLSAWRGRRPPF